MLKNKIFCLNLPIYAFATFLKAVIPTKLTIKHCLRGLEKNRNVNNISRLSYFYNNIIKIL